MKDQLLKFYKDHKIAAIAALIILIAGGYYIYNSRSRGAVVTSYILGTVEKGSIISSVTGSGQVTDSNQVDVKPKISANITAVYVKEGQMVKAGDLIAQLDDSDLVIQAKQAKNSLDIAKANLDLKLAGPTADSIQLSKNSVAAAKISYDNATVALENAKQTADQNLKKAQLSLENAQLSLDSAQKSYDNTLASQNISGDTITQTLNNAYANAKISLNSSLVTMRSGLTAANNILNTSDTNVKSLLGVADQQSLFDTQNDYSTAESKLNSFSADYNNSTWDHVSEDNLLNEALDAFQSFKTLEHDLYTVLSNTVTSSNLSQSTLDGYKSTASSQESSMISGINTIQSAIQSITNAKLGVSSGGISSSSSISNASTSLQTAKNNLITAQNSLEQTEQSNQNSITSAQNSLASSKLSYENAQTNYNILIAPPRAVDVASSKAQVAQAQNSYDLAMQNLSNAKILSPIDGQIAKVYFSAGEAAVMASASTASPIVTIITNKQLATVTLNEVDVAKVAVGQKANMTFYAISGLNIAGTVTSVDSIGTVSSGVVNYTVQIAFDTQDSRIKSQMSVTANIITAEKLDTLLVPNSAIKTDNSGNNYVQVFGSDAGLSQLASDGSVTAQNPPQNVSVQIGLSDDANTEILSGLKEGDQVVVNTINSATASAASAASSQTSALLALGGGGGFRGR